MELHNLIFMFLLLVIFSTVGLLILADYRTGYPGTNVANITVKDYSNLTHELSGNLSKANADMTVQANQPSVFDFIGYLGGAFQATIDLVSFIPEISSNIVGGYGAPSGLIPGWFLGVLTIAVSFIVIIGFLYYWTKIK